MGNTVSEVKTYLYVVKQNNINLPLLPFLHVIKDVVLDGHYVGLGNISRYKEKTIFLEVLDILTDETFFCQLDNSLVIEDESGSLTLGINVAEITYLPKPPFVKILSTKNELFKEGDAILGIENKNNDGLVELLEENQENKKIVILRDKEVFTVENKGRYLDCEIGIGILYKIEESHDYYIKGYNGRCTKQFKNMNENDVKNMNENDISGENNFINMTDREINNMSETEEYIKTHSDGELIKNGSEKHLNNESEFLSVQNKNIFTEDEKLYGKEEMQKRDLLQKLNHAHVNQFDYENDNKNTEVAEKHENDKLEKMVINEDVCDELNDYVLDEEKFLKGENQLEDAAVLVNDQFACAQEYEDPGLMKKEAYDERRSNKDIFYVKETSCNDDFKNSKENISKLFENEESDEVFKVKGNFKDKEEHKSKYSTGSKSCIHFSDCDCEKNDLENNTTKENKSKMDFLSESDDENKKYF
ncbi:hypothetical protein EHP00_1005 [Ecytonucleospora hepatopenaei]|uniref:Uncharacterized protein n=1 Tax=Ecytonucleospora hepatopenaei TaxID=646526 RepID=A0A1W0E688_9MICR|nr:hypothetical protein EHP00_1005 [Ecytonucleospora hepatopenaei]